jgi:hypothetical protein
LSSMYNIRSNPGPRNALCLNSSIALCSLLLSLAFAQQDLNKSSLPIVDLWYERHQAAYLNVSLLCKFPVMSNRAIY